MSTNRRRGDVRAADRLEHVHVAFRDFESVRSFGVVVNDPIGKADGAFDSQTMIGDSFSEVLQVAAVFDVSVQFANPRFDAVVTRFGGEFDFLDDAELLPADRACVQAVAKLRLIR